MPYSPPFLRDIPGHEKSRHFWRQLPTSGHFVSLGRLGLAGGRLVSLGRAALAGLCRLLASGLRFILLRGTATAGLFRFASGGLFRLTGSLLLCGGIPGFLYLSPGRLSLFAHELIDLLKGHYHIAGIGLCGPGLFLLGCGSGGLFGSRGLGLASRYRLGSLRDFFLTGARVQ